MGDNKQQEPLDLADLGGALPSGLTAEDRAGLVSALKNKLQSLAGQHALEMLTPRVRKRVEFLREIQACSLF